MGTYYRPPATIVNWGLIGAAGPKLQAGSGVGIPLMIRADLLNRYGALAIISVLTGVEF
jgi:hypothetical protein